MIFGDFPNIDFGMELTQEELDLHLKQYHEEWNNKMSPTEIFERLKFFKGKIANPAPGEWTDEEIADWIEKNIDRSWFMSKNEQER